LAQKQFAIPSFFCAVAFGAFFSAPSRLFRNETQTNLFERLNAVLLAAAGSASAAAWEEEAMVRYEEMQSSAEELEQAIERRIRGRTASRIRHLRIEVGEDLVVVRGRTDTYYAKQLAIQAVMEILTDPDRPRPFAGILVSIDVGSAADLVRS
jgi:hypothetical protein